MDLLAWRLRWIFRRETWFLTSQLQSNLWTTELSGCLHDTSLALPQVAFPLLLPFYIAVHCPIAEFNCFTLWDSQRVIWAKPPLTLLHGQLVKFQCRVTFSFQWGSLLKDSIVMDFHVFQLILADCINTHLYIFRLIEERSRVQLAHCDGYHYHNALCRLTISLMRVVPEPKKEHDCTVCSSLEHSFTSASLRSLNSNFLFGNILLPHSCVCPNSSKHCGFCCKTLILTVPAGLFLFAALKNTNRASGKKNKKLHE